MINAQVIFAPFFFLATIPSSEREYITVYFRMFETLLIFIAHLADPMYSMEILEIPIYLPYSRITGWESLCIGS